ncbi:MAG TPA: hypothetical protein VHY32_02860 [Caulobacteraceae bacterium]|jgi:hypothetical protein|nr:hypothetical protein [Caulobacteraceae bacterium]
MSDRLTLSLLALLALAMIGFAAVWPQGLGDRSPGPFGHVPIQRTPAMQAALARADARAQQQVQENRAAAEAAKRAAGEKTGPLRLGLHAMPLPIAKPGADPLRAAQ